MIVTDKRRMSTWSCLGITANSVLKWSKIGSRQFSLKLIIQEELLKLLFRARYLGGGDWEDQFDAKS